jgi:hypothetical protein
VVFVSIGDGTVSGALHTQSNQQTSYTDAVKRTYHGVFSAGTRLSLMGTTLFAAHSERYHVSLLREKRRDAGCGSFLGTIDAQAAPIALSGARGVPVVVASVNEGTIEIRAWICWCAVGVVCNCDRFGASSLRLVDS